MMEHHHHQNNLGEIDMIVANMHAQPSCPLPGALGTRPAHES
jgi:hypothetical protein